MISIPTWLFVVGCVGAGLLAVALIAAAWLLAALGGIVEGVFKAFWR